jgi:4-aminobutyrate aminotransferase-like enzyme
MKYRLFGSGDKFWGFGAGCGSDIVVMGKPIGNGHWLL